MFLESFGRFRVDFGPFRLFRAMGLDVRRRQRHAGTLERARDLDSAG